MKVFPSDTDQSDDNLSALSEVHGVHIHLQHRSQPQQHQMRIGNYSQFSEHSALQSSPPRRLPYTSGLIPLQRNVRVLSLISFSGHIAGMRPQVLWECLASDAGVGPIPLPAPVLTLAPPILPSESRMSAEECVAAELRSVCRQRALIATSLGNSLDVYARHMCRKQL